MKPPSLSRRLLVWLALVSLVYWLIIASLKVEDDIAQVHELYDVHLVHTALALLRLMDPDDHQPTPVPAHLTRATVDTLFENWPDLPDRRTGRRDTPGGVFRHPRPARPKLAPLQHLGQPS